MLDHVSITVSDITAAEPFYDAVMKALEVARFSGQHDKVGETERAMFELERKIAESEKCIAGHDRQTRRPLGTDFGSLKNVSWGNWSAHK